MVPDGGRGLGAVEAGPPERGIGVKGDPIVLAGRLLYDLTFELTEDLAGIPALERDQASHP
jgi:nitrogenase subunit NifH